MYVMEQCNFGGAAVFSSPKMYHSFADPACIAAWHVCCAVESVMGSVSEKNGGMLVGQSQTRPSSNFNSCNGAQHCHPSQVKTTATTKDSVEICGYADLGDPKSASELLLLALHKSEVEPLNPLKDLKMLCLWLRAPSWLIMKFIPIYTIHKSSTFVSGVPFGKQRIFCKLLAKWRGSSLGMPHRQERLRVFGDVESSTCTIEGFTRLYFTHVHLVFSLSLQYSKNDTVLESEFIAWSACGGQRLQIHWHQLHFDGVDCLIISIPKSKVIVACYHSVHPPHLT